MIVGRSCLLWTDPELLEEILRARPEWSDDRAMLDELTALALAEMSAGATVH